ncbi:MAG: hexosaminidase [Gammaproteobacteria bacterium]|jgi:hexosaminidase
MRDMTWSGIRILAAIMLFGIIGCKEKIEIPVVANYDVIPDKNGESDFSGGFFIFHSLTITGPEDFRTEVMEFSSFCKKHFNVDLKYSTDTTVNSQFKIEYAHESELHTVHFFTTGLSEEAYSMLVSQESVLMAARSSKGVTAGLATLKQLLFLNELKGHYFIPEMRLTDQPRFEHRGLLLDCSRHFFSVDVVKKYIDLLSLYKMNVLHWHLTEDQGWRIAIDKYPKLTEVGAYRTEEDGSIYGGFYTKEEIREVVAYAEKKNINIIPEIELPGHSQAAIAAYPHLSCTGEQVDVVNDWGVFKEIYCAGNDSTFLFLEDVLTEVIDLFPSKYIHIGGDEAPKTRWKACDKCQKRMHDHHLEDEHELQSYFIKRIQSFLKTKNKELIGWDEILEGGLAEGAIVQSWRGMQGGIDAVKNGNKAIMSPTSHAYLDYSLRAIDLEKVYSFNPIPSELTEEESKLIIGGEVNMWTEHVPDEANLDSKVFPRLLAMSEILWTGNEQKNYDSFLNRVYKHHDILTLLNVEYGIETEPFDYQIISTKEGVNVGLNKNSKKAKVHSFTNGKEIEIPDGGLNISKREKKEIETYATLNGKAIGDTVSLSVMPHLMMMNQVEYVDSPYSDWYRGGGDSALVDGVLGSLDFRDGHWQGFWGNDLECIVLANENKIAVTSIEANFYQYNNSWIFIPKEMIVEYSDNEGNWHLWGRTISEVDPKRRGKFIHTMKVEGGSAHFKDLRIRVINQGKVPDWHEAAGSDAWIFIDEIIVK